MFQNFDDIADPSLGPERVALLRRELARRKLAGFLVPRADEHMGEYVPACAERLSWLTGFTGSAGIAVILARKAALFVDGRYTLQAGDQADAKTFDVLQIPANTPAKWLSKVLKKGARLGYDPRLHSVRAVERLEKSAGEAGFTLVPQKSNPVDKIWKNRPPPPDARVHLHPLKYAGESSARKIARLQADLRKAGTDAAVLTLPDSIAWLLNIRGSDVPHTPVALCFAILHARKKPELFIEGSKLTASIRRSLAKLTAIRQPDALERQLKALGKGRKTVGLDPDTASAWFAQVLEKSGAGIVLGPDPCLVPKARKNAKEITGARAAHLRDGAAMARFLAWLDAHAPSGRLDEIMAAEELEAMRAETGKLREISFDTISGAGPNGAIVHYRVTRATNAKLKKGSLYLVDSGAQYADGTTDITRTIAVGKPTAAMRRHFTLVLKGHIAVATARFPTKTRGADLDPLARAPLWQAGLDFDHGTGHGVGSYLSVHEGPQRISRLGNAVLEPGMICSNEPGYYRAGKYGIRIENLLVVTESAPVRGGERDMMGFETLTLAPMDTRLIDPELLTSHELDWLNAYHARVHREIGALLKGADKAWLAKATAPLEGP
jgi:Xaa-Pro aminopeptidase